MTRRIKALLGWIIFRSGLYRLLFRRMAVVVLFHRIDNRYPDEPITCSEEKFTAYCRFLSQYFTVVPLSELLRKLSSGESIARHAVITFDDGYLDNFAFAAPWLKSRELPATFFIATNFIESSAIPWWDADAGIRSEWMTWEHVRKLAEMGFETGAHTCNHVDLGVVRGAEAEREIRDSGERLRRELGRPVPLFSYPYGRVNQITEENRTRVRDAGYSCCLSAYGGTVAPGDDPFRLRRTAVSHWHISAYQFGFEVWLDHVRGIV